MADVSESAIGRMVDSAADPGESMKGVKAQESVFGGKVADDFAVFEPGTVFDPNGKPFAVPVDSEHKATVFKPWTFGRPHMLSFHVNWSSFFITFVAVFAAAPLVPILREDINLTKQEAGSAGVAVVTGTVFVRIMLGTICDVFGPRWAHAILQLLCAPAVFCLAIIETGTGFIIGRLFIGFNLSTFVACQFWCSIMFTPKIVGVTNATAGGWGNLGGGVTQLLMPLIYQGIARSIPPFLAWRWTFFVPGALMICAGAACLFCAQDLPDGQYAALKKSGVMKKQSPLGSFLCGVRNYRTWIMVVQYGFCFGVELTMNNVVTPYFYDQFGMPLTVAGALGSLFGLMNLFARSLGGFTSDLLAKRYGMAGRLWNHYLWQVMEGIFCILMGLSYKSLPATVCLMVCFSACVQAAEGATFGIVPFISKRGLGIVSGFVGAGGNSGSIFMQTIFFVSDRYTTNEGILWMGVTIICVTQLLFLVWFPMWGGMVFGPREGISEAEYYTSEFSKAEQSEGLHEQVLKFAAASKSERPPSKRDDNFSTHKVDSSNGDTAVQMVQAMKAQQV